MRSDAVHKVELQVLIGSDHFTARAVRTIRLPFVPFPGLVLVDKTCSLKLEDVAWNTERHVFSGATQWRCSDERFGEETEAWKKAGWDLFDVGPAVPPQPKTLVGGNRMAAPQFELIVGVNNLTQFRLMGLDGKPVLVSQGFGSKDDCFAAVRAVKENAPYPERFVRRTEDGKLAFRLMSASHQVVGNSIAYDREEERDRAIAVVRGSPEAIIIDRTI
jgi:uncharacterized protein YegP (UPF0339 family)